MLRWIRSGLLMAVLFTIVAALYLWRASEGRTGAKEMAIIWAIVAVVN